MGGKRFVYLCALAGCMVFYIAYQQWLGWLLLVAVAALPWLSLAVSLPGILTFRASVDAPEVLPLGDSTELTIVGGSRFPVPPFTGRLRLRRCITGETWLHKKGTALESAHCGGILATPEKVRVCDYLGLFRFPVKRVESRFTLVRAAVEQPPRVPDLRRYLAGSWRPKPGGGYSENHELRLYRPGDSLNQLHWKLTAKTGKLTIREPMEPNRGLVLVTVDICGTAQDLDRKFGRLEWLGPHLLDQGVSFTLRALTGEGSLSFPVKHPEDLRRAIDRLLCCAPAGEGSVGDGNPAASWHCHIGGGPDEP